MPETILLNNRYLLEERQAQGGMAMVYRAHDLVLERSVAVKILRKDLSRDPHFRERFHQEAKAAAGLSHPNLVTIHDFGLDNEQLFIVMEYVPGTDFKTILKRRGRLPITEGVGLILQACAGIGYAHRAGLVHCDIKPQNMLVTPEGQLKVVDFGIARLLTSISPDEKAEVVWGSPIYFSPEQARGEPPSPASDVYSLGVVLYEALAGQPPFSGGSAEQLAEQHRMALPPSPRKLNPEIPAPLEQILLATLAKEPSARFRSADQLGRVLSNAITPADGYTPLPAPASQQAPLAGPPLATGDGRRQTAAASKQPAPRPAPPVQAASVAGRSAAAPIDWLTWLLVFLAIIALGGLIPFWLWVYYLINPPL